MERRTWQGLCWKDILVGLGKNWWGKDGDGGREALGMVNCSVNIWDRSKLELAWPKESSLYFENKYPIFLLSGISNT